jgi:hypothetical protein
LVDDLSTIERIELNAEAGMGELGAHHHGLNALGQTWTGLRMERRRRPAQHKKQ